MVEAQKVIAFDFTIVVL